MMRKGRLTLKETSVFDLQVQFIGAKIGLMGRADMQYQFSDCIRICEADCHG